MTDRTTPDVPNSNSALRNLPLDRLARRLPRALRPALYMAAAVSLGAIILPPVVAAVVALRPDIDLSTALALGYRHIWRLALVGGCPVILSTLVYGLLRALANHWPIALAVPVVGIPSALTLLVAMGVILECESGRASGAVLSQPGFLGFGMTFLCIAVGLGCLIAWSDLSGKRR